MKCGMHTCKHTHTHDIIQPLKDEILTHATTRISLFKISVE